MSVLSENSEEGILLQLMRHAEIAQTVLAEAHQAEIAMLTKENALLREEMFGLRNMLEKPRGK